MIYLYSGSCPKCENTDKVNINIADQKSYLIYECSKCRNKVKILLHCEVRTTVITNPLFGIQLGLHDTMKQLSKANETVRKEYVEFREKRKKEKWYQDIKKFFNRGKVK